MKIISRRSTSAEPYNFAKAASDILGLCDELIVCDLMAETKKDNIKQQLTGIENEIKSKGTVEEKDKNAVRSVLEEIQSRLNETTEKMKEPLKDLLSSMQYRKYEFEYTSDHQKKSFYLYLPKNLQIASKIPCLVFMHGGSAMSPLILDKPEESIANMGTGKAGISWTLLPLIGALTSKGFCVATITFARLSEEDSLHICQQIKNQVEIIKKSEDVDTERMFFIGHSFGGYALSQMLTNPEGLSLLNETFKLGVGFESPAGITKEWAGGTWTFSGNDNDVLKKLGHFENETGRSLVVYGYYWNDREKMCRHYADPQSDASGEQAPLSEVIEKLQQHFNQWSEDYKENETEKKRCACLSQIFSLLLKDLPSSPQKESEIMEQVNKIMQTEEVYAGNMLAIHSAFQRPFDDRVGLRTVAGVCCDAAPSSVPGEFPNINIDLAKGASEAIEQYQKWLVEAINWQIKYYEMLKQQQKTAVSSFQHPIYIFGATGDFNSTPRQYMTLERNLNKMRLPDLQVILIEYLRSLHWIHRIRDKYISEHPNKDENTTISECCEYLLGRTLGDCKQNFNTFVNDITNILLLKETPGPRPIETGRTDSEIERKRQELIQRAEILEDADYKKALG